MQKPKLRPIEAFPIVSEGKQLLCLRDPLHLSDKMVLLSYQTTPLLSLMDGTHSVVDIQSQYAKRSGDILFSEELEKLIQTLDECYLLDSPRFKTYREQLETDFLSNPLRPPAHAGGAYEKEREKLIEQMDGYFTQGESPPLPPLPIVSGLIAPHIDFRRGWRSYVQAYRFLQKAPCPDCFVILGTSHYAPHALFTATKKDFETPLGVTRTDMEMVDRLIERYPYPLFEDEFYHKMEHSIEFQVILLQYLFPNTPFFILPILCGSFHKLIDSGQALEQSEPFRRFVEVLKETIVQSKKRVCIIAGADLSHMGTRFGDPPLTPSLLEWIESEDRTMVSTIVGNNPLLFWELVLKDKDKRKVCGIPPISTLLSLMEGEKGILLDYDKAIEGENESVVSFTSVGFYQQVSTTFQ